MSVAGGPTRVAVTVVVPCFNYGRFVRCAVQSALCQVGADVQVVVVNDGSTDGRSARECDRCAGARVRVIHQDNSGPPAARNRGAAGAQGEFLVFLDADDWIEPDFVRLLASELRSQDRAGRTDVSHVYSQQRMVQKSGSTVWEVPEWDSLTMMVANLHPVTALVKRERFEAVGGFSPEMRGGYEDWDLWLKFVERGWRGVRVRQPLFVYRRHSPNTHNRRAVSNHEELFRRIVRAHAAIYAAHADELISRMNLLLRAHDMNWLDESGEPINFLALKRQREKYESMGAIRIHHAIHRVIGGLPGPLSGAFRGLLGVFRRAVSPAVTPPAAQGGPNTTLSAKNNGAPVPNVGVDVTVLPAGSRRPSWAKMAPSTSLPTSVNTADTDIE